jgi:hypothetical protein
VTINEGLGEHAGLGSGLNEDAVNGQILAFVAGGTQSEDVDPVAISASPA